MQSHWGSYGFMITYFPFDIEQLPQDIEKSENEPATMLVDSN